MNVVLGVKVPLPAASIWEPAGCAGGRCPGLAGNDPDFATRHLSGMHVLRTSRLPAHHRDPFDRMIVAQALVEGVPVFSSDIQLDAYGIQRFSP